MFLLLCTAWQAHEQFILPSKAAAATAARPGGVTDLVYVTVPPLRGSFQSCYVY